MTNQEALNILDQLLEEYRSVLQHYANESRNDIVKDTQYYQNALNFLQSQVGN